MFLCKPKEEKRYVPPQVFRKKHREYSLIGLPWKETVLLLSFFPGVLPASQEGFFQQHPLSPDVREF